MFPPRWQDPPDIQVPNINSLVLGLLTRLLTAVQYLEVHIRIHGKKEREGVALVSGTISDSVDRGGKFAIGLTLQILAYIADKCARFGRGVDPYAILIQHFQCRDIVLQDKSKPWIIFKSALLLLLL